MGEPGERAAAGEKAARRVQDRTPQRNRKQRNTTKKHKNDNTKNDGGGGQPGTAKTDRMDRPDCLSATESFEGCAEACGEIAAVSRSVTA